jgi:hypothetical protein
VLAKFREKNETGRGRAERGDNVVHDGMLNSELGLAFLLGLGRRTKHGSIPGIPERERRTRRVEYS